MYFWVFTRNKINKVVGVFGLFILSNICVNIFYLIPLLTNFYAPVTKGIILKSLEENYGNRIGLNIS